MNKTMTCLALAAATATVALLAGCASPSYPITPEGHAKASSETPAAPGERDFPSIDSAKWQQGSNSRRGRHVDLRASFRCG